MDKEDIIGLLILIIRYSLQIIRLILAISKLSFLFIIYFTKKIIIFILKDQENYKKKIGILILN